MEKKTPTFEEAMARLREITEILEKGDETLERSIELFSEGTALTALCYETLEKAEQKLTELSELEGSGEDE